jgi:RimJ/RimL family protein N-acetyltransferase
MILETKRLLLRPPAESDIADIIAFASDPEVALRTAQIPHPYTDADARDWLRIATANERAGTTATFMLELRAEARVIGSAALRVRDVEHTGNVGFALARPYWSRGLVTEAMIRIFDYAFDQLRLEAIDANAVPTNRASIRVQEKLGMRYTRNLVIPARARGGDQHVVERAISRREWLERITSTGVRA